MNARDLPHVLWRGKWLILAMTLAITGVVTAAAFLVPPRYEATVLMIPAPDTESADRLGSLGSAASQLGGLASLAGISSSGSGMKIEAEATLQSEALTSSYIRGNNLLPILFRRKWDSARMQWKTTDPAKVPTIWKGNRYFHDIRTVTDNARTGLISLTISWRDPEQAAKWANDLVGMTNEYLRNKAILEAKRNIEFLEEQAKANSQVALQMAISTLTESQMKKIMLARSREQYALKVIDPATVPEKQSSPIPSIWIPAGFFVGLFLSVFIVILRSSGPTDDTSPS